MLGPGNAMLIVGIKGKCGFREIRSSRVHCDTAALARATGKRSDFLKLTFRVNVGPRTYQEPCRVF